MLTASDIATLKERLEVLDGSRRAGNADRAAVRIEDVAPGLLGLPDTLKATKATGSTVTVEAFNALIDDNRMLHRTLAAIATAIKARRSP